MAGAQKEILEKLNRLETLLAGQQPPPMDLKECAAYLHLSKATVYRLTSQSLLGHFKAGKKLVFVREDLDRYLLAHRVQTREELQGK